MRKFLTFFLTALLAFGVGWASEVTDVLEVYDFITNWTSTAYQTKSGVQRNSNAVYTGTVARGESQANPSIQLRKNNDDSGIVTTTSGGKVKSVTIEFNSFLTTTRSANIFGKNSAYSQPTDLWSANTKGTQLGSISSASTANKTLTIDGEYEYIGIASSSGTIYIDKITIVWEVPDAGAPTLNVTPTSLTITDPTGDDNSGTITATVENTTNAITYEATTGWSADVSGNKVYYNDKALSANGTITYKCDGASNVPVTVNYNYTGPLYIIGTVNNGTWAPNNYVQLSKGDDGLYTVTLTTAAGNEGMSWISFTKRIANDNDDYAWAYIAPYRFSPMGETVNTDWWLNDQTINKFNALDFNPDHAGKQAIRMEPGEYKITINPATNEFKIEKILGEVTYQKVMSTSDVTSGNYLIVYEGENVALDGSLETLDATGNTQGITIENDKITTNQPIWFTYDASAKTLKSYSGFFIGHTGTKNTLNQSATFSDNYVNNITIANGNALITIPEDNYELKYNATSGQDRFRYFSSGNSQQAVQLYKEYDPNRVATPTFLPAAGTYNEVQTVTISCATDGATIYYSTDGGTTWNEGNSVPVNVTTTIQAKATKQGMTDSHIATATYVIDLPASVNTISAVNALETGKDFVFNNQAVVVYRKGNQMWIQDYNPTAGGALVYGQNLTFEAEDVLAVGWTGTTSTNSGNKQIINLVAQIDNENTPKKPVAIPRTSLSADNEQEYVLLEGVTISDDLKITLDTRGEVVLYPSKFNMYNGFEPQEGVTYDVKGIFDIYGETYEIYPLEITPNQVDPGLAFAKESVEVYVGQVPENALTPEGLTVNYSSTNTAVATVNATTGEVTTVGPGTTTITAIFSGNNEYLADTASYTLTVNPKPVVLEVEPTSLTMSAVVGQEPATATFMVSGENLRGDITLTMNSDAVFSIDPTTISKDDAIGEVTVTYTPTQAGTDNATITITTEGHEEAVTVTVTGTATVPEVVATPTFSLVSGSYTGPQTVIINCATEGATIKYSTDGGNSWNEGNTVNVDKDMTIQVMAERDGMTASTATATYIIDIPEVKPTMEPFDGYFKVMNNGNQKFVNVAGRKTITFANEANIDKMAGTVVYLKTDEHGQVQSLRSQAADLQGYADRAMRYVPELVELAINKLHAEGVGEILGEHGYVEIMEKFNESFDHHLYVEAAEGGYRLYGKTPSMQPVVDFYREHTHQVEAKLPQLEAFINSAIEKVLEKTGGRGASILQPFSVHQIWHRMDSALVDASLTEPVDEASTMAFYREVLNNKNYVWDFAYETAMTYWERLKNNQTFIDNKDKLGEFAQYLDKIEDVRPDFKYYIVQENNKIDYISEGNVDIKTNQPRTAWTLTPRDKFTVNFASNMTMDDRLYYTTLYTDFAYSLPPEGVKAYKVTEVNENGVGAIEALEGTIPAQTAVLLKANAAGDVELTIAAAGDADMTGNLLVGADYFINKYQINTPQVEGLFEMVASIFGENSTFYQELLTKYGHLMLKTSGTVNNKYFWALTNDDLNQCVVQNELGEQDCVVRTLDKDEDGIGFYGEWKAPANQAFLASDKFNPVKLLLGKDVTRDGLWNVADVTATISIILETAPEGNNYDLDAADFDNNGRINVADVTAMIAYILGKVN